MVAPDQGTWVAAGTYFCVERVFSGQDLVSARLSFVSFGTFVFFMFSVTQILSILPAPLLSAMVLWGQALGSGEVDLPGGLVSPCLCTAHPECWEWSICLLGPVPLLGAISTVLGPPLLAVGHVLPQP